MTRPRPKRLTPKQRRLAKAAWRARRPHDVVVLAIDPGEVCGVAVLEGTSASADFPLPVPIYVEDISSWTTLVEDAVDLAVTRAELAKCPVVLVTEKFGKGGPLGLDQWMGLGGWVMVWRRAWRLYCDAYREPVVPARPGRWKIAAHQRQMRVMTSTWRSGMFDEWHNGEWKGAAQRRLLELSGVQAPPNAAEAALMGMYVSKTEAMGELLPRQFRTEGA